MTKGVRERSRSYLQSKARRAKIWPRKIVSEDRHKQGRGRRVDRGEMVAVEGGVV